MQTIYQWLPPLENFIDALHRSHCLAHKHDIAAAVRALGSAARTLLTSVDPRPGDVLLAAIDLHGFILKDGVV